MCVLPDLSMLKYSFDGIRVPLNMEQTKESILKMKLIKKGLLTFGATIAVTGAFAMSPTVEVEAAQWEARTISEVKEDIQSTDEESSYTIQWGDTLGAITAAFGVGMNEVAQINEIGNLDLIIAGNVLHFSADQKTVSIEDTQTKKVQTFDISEDEAEEIEEPEQIEEPAEEPSEEPAEAAPTTSPSSDSEAEAKAWIAFKESTDNYDARNGKYIGKYQLTNTYLDGDYSPENQERVADEYVSSRYGSWVAAKDFWLQNGWY